MNAKEDSAKAVKRAAHWPKKRLSKAWKSVHQESAHLVMLIAKAR